MADFPDAQEYLVDEQRVFIDQNSHSAIVIHGTGGNANQTAQQLGDWFRSDPAMASSHYGIDRSGVVCQFVLEKDGAAANCCVKQGHDSFWDQFNGENLNLHTISIEHVNDSTNSLPLTQAQQDASFKLVAYLCHKYSIPTDNIKTHASIDPINRSQCPGNYPMDALKSFVDSNATQPLQGGNNDMVVTMSDSVMQQYFVQQGDHIVRRDNPAIYMFGANADFYMRLGGIEICGLPTGCEYYPQDGVAILPCERVLIVYDPKRVRDNPPISGDNYLEHIDGLQGQIDTLKAELAAAQQPVEQAQIASLEAKLKQINQLSLV